MTKVAAWTTRCGVFLLSLGILEHIDWAKDVGFGLVVGVSLVDVGKWLLVRYRRKKTSEIGNRDG